MTATYKDMRAKAKMPERTVPTCFRGDLIAEFEALDRELKDVAEANPDSLDSGTGELLDRMSAIQAEMRENTYPVRLRSLPGPQFRKLKAQHPPLRTDDGEIDPANRGFDFNPDTFFEPLLRACLVDPEMVTRDDWEEFVDGLTDNQFNELAVTALTLNRGSVDIPFSLAASRMSRSSGGE